MVDPAPAGAQTKASAKRLVVSLAALTAIPTLVLLDFLVAAARGWRVESPLDRVVLIVSGVVVGLAALATLLPAGRTFLRKRVVKFIALGLISALGLLVTEVAVGVILDPTESFGRFHRKPPGSHYTFRPSPEVMPGVEGDAHYRTNELGVRGVAVPPRDEAYRILCVGGSTTVCAYLDDSETWPTLLMETLNQSKPKLPVWVGNAGRNAFLSKHHVQLLQERELLETMDCVVVLVGINDLCYQLKKRTRSMQVGLPPLWRRSRTVEALTWAIRRRMAVDVEDKGGKVYEVRRRQRQAGPLIPELPDMAAPLDVYAEAIRTMSALCKEAGVRPVFVSQPTLWGAETSPDVEALFWMGKVAGGGYLATPALREGMDRYNQRLEAVCQELGVEFVSLASLDERPEVFYDDCHFTEAGARDVARLVAAHFASQGWTRER